MNIERPDEPENVDRTAQSEIRGLSPNSISPRPVPIGFPVDAVANLRAEQRQLDPDGVEVGVSRQAVEEVLAWIDRYVPRPVATTEDAVVVDAIKVLTIDGDAFLDEVDLIRCNGRAFVLEPPVLDMESRVGELIEKAEAWPGWAGEDALSSTVMGAFLAELSSALRIVNESLLVAERTRDDCRRASEENINRRRELAERVLDCEVMLSAAAARFREYERHHMGKGNLDGESKARANAEIAERIEALLMGLAS